eukprot:2897891-Heterocapsa_arctica.AAC.1
MTAIFGIDLLSTDTPMTPHRPHRGSSLRHQAHECYYRDDAASSINKGSVSRTATVKRCAMEPPLPLR